MKTLTTFLFALTLCLFLTPTHAQTSKPGKCVESFWNNGVWAYSGTTTFEYDALGRETIRLGIDTITGDTLFIFISEYTMPSPGVTQYKQTANRDNGNGLELDQEFISKQDRFGNTIASETYKPDPNNGGTLTLQAFSSTWEYKYDASGSANANCDTVVTECIQYRYDDVTMTYKPIQRQLFEYNGGGVNQRSATIFQTSDGSGGWINSVKEDFSLFDMTLVAQYSSWDGSGWEISSRVTTEVYGDVVNSSTAEQFHCARATTPNPYMFDEDQKVRQTTESYDVNSATFTNSQESEYSSKPNGGYDLVVGFWNSMDMQYRNSSRTEVERNTLGETTSSTSYTWNTQTMGWDVSGGSQADRIRDANGNITQFISRLYNSNTMMIENSFRQDYSDFTTVVSIPANSLQQVRLYPNPFTNSLTLKLKEGQTAVSYTLTDLTGRMVSAGDITGADVNLNLENLKAGTYILNLTDGGNTVATQRVVKW